MDVASLREISKPLKTGVRDFLVEKEACTGKYKRF
jgi:hypothetical protein